MSRDITDILNDWEFDPDDQYRIIQAEDGRGVLQVRQPLGIEQYELDGRPDGLRPFGKDSVLIEMHDRLEASRALGTTESFRIEHDDFLQLQNEGILYYYRYLILFQMGDYARTAEDTAHNLAICALVDEYAVADEDKRDLLQYRPYILRMSAISRAMLALEEDRRGEARSILEQAIERVEQIDEVDTPTFQFERVRSLQYLRSAMDQIVESPSPVSRLRRELAEAVETEDYERAARLRDKIRLLEESDS